MVMLTVKTEIYKNQLYAKNRKETNFSWNFKWKQIARCFPFLFILIYSFHATQGSIKVNVKAQQVLFLSLLSLVFKVNFFSI